MRVVIIHPSTARVHFAWILKDRVYTVPAIRVQALVKTTGATGMAGDAADLLDLQEDNVVVTVQTDLPDRLHVAGFLSLAPELAARA